MPRRPSHRHSWQFIRQWYNDSTCYWEFYCISCLRIVVIDDSNEFKRERII